MGLAGLRLVVNRLEMIDELLVVKGEDEIVQCSYVHSTVLLFFLHLLPPKLSSIFSAERFVLPNHLLKALILQGFVYIFRV